MSQQLTATKKILKELQKWYSLRELVETQPGVQSGSINSFPKLNFDPFIETIIAKSTSSPSTSAIINSSLLQFKNTNSSDKTSSILITPNKQNLLSVNPEEWKKSGISNNSEESRLQGNFSPSNKNFYTTDDYIKFSDDSDGKLNKVSVIQVFSSQNTNTTIDTELVSAFMNSAITTEMSRAVPYLNISVAIPYSSEEEEASVSSSRYMSLGRFLLGDNSDPNYKWFTRSNPVLVNVDTKPNEKMTEEGAVYKIATGLEAFTTPQTLVNADDAYGPGGWLSSKKVLDPFQPFMSLQEFKVSITGQGGLMSYKSGSLSLVLHDRSRLNEIASLVAPSRFGSTRLGITYGYSHPDGSNFAYDDKTGNLIGKLIDSMKITETYIVTNVSFNFEQTSVKINLDISMMSSKSLEEIDIVESNDNVSLKQLRELIRDLNEAIFSLNSRGEKNTLKPVTMPDFLQSPDALSSSILKDTDKIKEIKEFRNKLAQKNSAGIGELVNKLLGSNVDQVGGSLGSVLTSKLNEVNNILASLKSTPDPFLPSLNSGIHHDSFAHDPKSKVKSSVKYISFGKIISYFIGKGLSNYHKNIGKPLDIQIIFYPFNQDAAGMQDYNLSQFPILWTDFELIIKEIYTNLGVMSVSKFCRTVVDYFVNDLASSAYGFFNDAQRSTYARDADKSYQRAVKETKSKESEDKKTETKSFEEILGEQKDSRLKKIYYPGTSKDFPAQFRRPEISFDIQATPLRNTFLDPDNVNFDAGVIIKVHVMDRTNTPLNSLGAVMQAAGSNRLVPKLTRFSRDSSSPYVSNHSSNSQKMIDFFVEKSIIEKIDNQFDEVARDEARRPNEIKVDSNALQYLKENYYLFSPKLSLDELRRQLQSIYPTLHYGSLNSGINSLNVSSMHDSQLSTIMLIRNANEGFGAENKRNTSVPLAVMPVELSAECIGCPFFSYAQFFYVDLGTNTNIDNVYSVTNIDHSVGEGKFSTSIKMIQFESYGVYTPMDDDMKKAALNAVLHEKGVQKAETASSRNNSGPNRSQSSNPSGGKIDVASQAAARKQ
jgi:hypothetical protein